MTDAVTLGEIVLDCDEGSCDARVEADHDPAISDVETYVLIAVFAAALGWQVGQPVSDPTALDFCPLHRG